MLIVHICLAAVYIEGWGYQENILPRYHAFGNTVYVLASDYSRNAGGIPQTKTESAYTNKDGVHVQVLRRRHSALHAADCLNAFEDVYGSLDAITPDIIFVHGGQFISLKDVLRYCKRHPAVRLFIDQHGDYYNMPLSNLKRRILHKCIFGHYMRKAVKYTEKFWGVTPWRCQYLREVYGIPAEKTDLLVMGGDDQYIHLDRASEIRAGIRKQYGIADEDFVLITGGKIDAAKNIHLLMQAVKEINDPSLKLIVFGQPDDKMKPVIEELSRDAHIINIGWLSSEKVYDYFIASDLAVFPGTHSVLWEQACACGTPGMFRLWDGMTHVNVNGSAVLMPGITKEALVRQIGGLYRDKARYAAMKQAAMTYCVPYFSYREIAKRAIAPSEEHA